MLRLSSLTFSFAALLALGCERPAREGAADGVSGAEPSPNANLLPDPLPGVSALGPKAEDKSVGALVAALPLAVETELLPDELLLTPAEGDLALEFTVRLVEGRPRRSGPKGTHDAETGELVMAGALWASANRKSERLRLTLGRGPWLLPLGSELRARSDRHGHILVWPDGRSYRVASAGSLLSLLGERRADAMPRFTPAQTEARGDAALGMRVLFSTPMGRLRLDAWPRDSGLELSGQMLCRTLLDLIRARAAEACARMGFVRAAELELEGGETVKFQVTSPTKALEAQSRKFLVPPEMPIFKAGEYPPGPLGPFSAQEEAEAWRALGFEVRPSIDAANFMITNGRGVPLLLSIDDRPVRYLAAFESLFLAGKRALTYEAGSPFGLVPSTKGRVEPNTDLLLGGSPESQALGKPRSEE